MRILVTGSDGFVGRYLLPALRAAMPAGSHVVGASRSPHDEGRDEVFLNLLDEESVHRAVAEVRPAAVIHLAAQSSVVESGGSASLTWAVNHGGSVALAKAVAAATPNATVLFASSAEVYGAAFNEGIVSERSPVMPLSPYAKSKTAAEQAFRDLLPDTSRLIVARPTNHSGAGQSDAFVIPSFARQIAEVEVGRRPMISVGQLASCRDFLDVADVVDGYTTLLSSAGDMASRSIFNVASGTSIAIGTILDQLCELAKTAVRIEADPARMRPSEVPAVRVDATALRSLGWAPRVSLRTTLERVLSEERRRCIEAA